MKKQVSTKTMPYLLVGGAVVLAAIVSAQTLNAGRVKPAVSAVVNQKPVPAVTVAKTDETRKPLEHYTGSVKGNLFSSPTPATPPPAVVVSKVKLPVLPKVPDVVPVPFDPFAESSYVGTVTVGDRTFAVVENSKTKEGTYLSVGDEYIGAKVTSIDTNSVALSVAGKEHRLAKLQDYKLTPLDASAPFLQQQQVRGPGGMMGPNGMPMGPGGAMGMMGMPGMPGGGMGGFGGMGRGGFGGGGNPWSGMGGGMNRFGGGAGGGSPDQMNRWQNRAFEGGGGRGGRNRGGGGGFGGGGNSFQMRMRGGGFGF